MEIIQKFLRYCFLFVLLFVLQSAGVFTWFGTQANVLLLLFLFLGMHKGKHGENPLPLMLVLSAFALFFSFLFFQVAFLPLCITVCLACVSYELRKLLTGDKFSDFLILISLCTIIFHTILFAIHGGAHENLFSMRYTGSTLLMMGKELTYNVILGSILWFLYERIKKK